MTENSTDTGSTTQNQTDPEGRSAADGPKYDLFLDCVHCGLCTSACPTYLETGDENNSPRGRIYLMRAVTDGRLEMSESVSRHLDLCLDCRSCETACPSGVQYGRLIEPFRVQMNEGSASSGAATRPDWFKRWFLFGLFPSARRLRMALGPARLAQKWGLDRFAENLGFIKLLPEKLQRMQEQLPKLEPALKALPERLPAVGTPRATVALFTGCVADAMFRRVNWATARVLQANGCNVIVPPAQQCCGAIHYHNGAAQPAIKHFEANSSAFPLDDVDAIIVNVAGCGAMLRDYGHIASELGLPADDIEILEKLSSKVKDISEFIAELGPLAPTGEISMRATYHDACHLAHAQNVRSQPRELMSMIPGIELLPLAESEICCGAAGSYNLTEPEMADQLGERKSANIQATGADAVITGNAGCSLQIQASLKRAGNGLPVYHPMELLDASYRNCQPQPYAGGMN